MTVVKAAAVRGRVQLKQFPHLHGAAGQHPRGPPPATIPGRESDLDMIPERGGAGLPASSPPAAREMSADGVVLLRPSHRHPQPRADHEHQFRRVQSPDGRRKTSSPPAVTSAGTWSQAAAEGISGSGGRGVGGRQRQPPRPRRVSTAWAHGPYNICISGAGFCNKTQGPGAVLGEPAALTCGYIPELAGTKRSPSGEAASGGGASHPTPRPSWRDRAPFSGATPA